MISDSSDLLDFCLYLIAGTLRMSEKLVDVEELMEILEELLKLEELVETEEDELVGACLLVEAAELVLE